MHWHTQYLITNEAQANDGKVGLWDGDPVTRNCWNDHDHVVDKHASKEHEADQVRPNVDRLIVKEEQALDASEESNSLPISCSNSILTKFYIYYVKRHHLWYITPLPVWMNGLYSLSSLMSVYLSRWGASLFLGEQEVVSSELLLLLSWIVLRGRSQCINDLTILRLLLLSWWESLSEGHGYVVVLQQSMN